MRTAPAAYWASWADCLQPLSQRYPALGAQLLEYLRGTTQNTPFCLTAVQQAAAHLDAAGMEDRPSWERLLAGARPRQPNTEDNEPGDWQHGWQFYATQPFEHNEHNLLLGELRNRGTAGPARLRSCGGPNSSVWPTITPTSEALRATNSELLTSLRFRLGLPVPQEGPAKLVAQSLTPSGTTA